MREFIDEPRKDPYFLETYLLVAKLLEDSDCKKDAERILTLAYEKALELVTDEAGKWPDKLEWGWLENRHIIRTFIDMGLSYWKNNKPQKAYNLFKKLLKTNPNDNQGVRYFMLAILEEMSKKKFDERFGKDGFWDDKIDSWFGEKVKNHEKKFSPWLKIFR